MEAEKISPDEIIAKFSIANHLIFFTLYQNTKMIPLFEFSSPIMKPNDVLREKVYELTSNVDLVYTEHKFFISGNIMIFVYEGNRIRINIAMRKSGLAEQSQRFLIKLIETFAEDFETDYSKELKEFDGDVKVFHDIEERFSKNLNLDLILPHYAKYVGFDPDEKLEQYIFGAADGLTRKIGYFYLPNLIYATKNYVIEKARDMVLMNPKKAKKLGINPDKVEFPDDTQFYVAMYNLRKMGMLVPIQIDELRSFSKIKYPRAEPQV